jgi:small-conductance mechanosensitive channel
MDQLTEWARGSWETVLDYLGSPAFYLQLVFIAVALVLAWLLAAFVQRHIALLRDEPRPGVLYEMRGRLHEARVLLPPLMAVIVLGAATSLGVVVLGDAWIIRAAQGVAVIILLFSLASHFIKNETVVLALKWIGVPLAILYVVGVLDDIVAHLDSVSVQVGNIHVSLYAVLRTILFGVVLFWLGRASNATGQRVIRTQSFSDAGTREVVSKLFEIGVYVLVFLLLINIMGIDLTALAVFGGALGVGLGFGLQQIASNFISGLIILLDRSITIGDFIELEDGRSGTLRELTMRSATLETFDGKDIMVPNELFITSTFVNWTHNNDKQRYSLNFQVAYQTDLEKMFDIVRDTVASHPKVLSGDDVPVAERPDAEIESFGDSGINILVEFWMKGIDDGENRVGADLLLMIWTALKANGIEIPFPQREVKILGEGKPSGS